MPDFVCTICGTVESTALSNYWVHISKGKTHEEAAQCTLCDPAIEQWHGQFPREKLGEGANTGRVVGPDGFLVRLEDLAEKASA